MGIGNEFEVPNETTATTASCESMRYVSISQSLLCSLATAYNWSTGTIVSRIHYASVFYLIIV